MTKKESISRSTTRKNICDAFFEIYKSKGIDKITVKEIIDYAGYNRSTFYEYFSDPYDVLEFLKNETLHDIKKIMFSSNKDNSNFLTRSMEIFNIRGEYIIAFLKDTDFINKYKEMIVADVFSSHSNKELNSIEFKILEEYVAYGNLYSLSYWYQHKEEFSPEMFFDLFHTIAKLGPAEVLQKLIQEKEDFYIPTK